MMKLRKSFKKNNHTDKEIVFKKIINESEIPAKIACNLSRSFQYLNIFPSEKPQTYTLNTGTWVGNLLDLTLFVSYSSKLLPVTMVNKPHCLYLVITSSYFRISYFLPCNNQNHVKLT